MRVTHFTFNFCFWCKSGYRVYNHNVYSSGTHQCICNFEGLLSCIWLGDQKIININT